LTKNELAYEFRVIFRKIKSIKCFFVGHKGPEIGKFCSCCGEYFGVTKDEK